MSEKETYGVELDLITKNYNQKFQDVINTTSAQAKMIEQKAKVNFAGLPPQISAKDFSLDLQSTEIKNYQSQIKNVLSDLKVGKIDTSQAKTSLNDLLSQIELTNNTFQKYTNTRIKINVDDSELSLLNGADVNTQLLDKYVQLTNHDLTKTSENAETLGNGLKSATNEAKRLNQTTSNVTKNTSELGRNFERTMNNGASSTKKMLFSLFSVHSVWSLISRASGNALSLNDDLNSRVNVLNSALGNMMLPIVQKIVGYIEYGVIFGAKVIQFFFGFNALAGLTTSNLKNSVKQAKELHKALAGFDEITNIGGSSKGSLAGGIKDDMKALDDFYKKIEEVENWMNKTGIYGFLENVKTGFEAIWKAVQPLWNYALKPMLDYVLAHPEILTTLFAIFLGNKLKNGIANIIGSGSTGLVGLNGNISKISAIASEGIILYFTIKGISENIQKVRDFQEELQNLGHTTNKTEETNKSFNKSMLELDDTSEKFNQGLLITKGNFDIYSGGIDTAIKGIKEMTNWEKFLDITIGGNNSTYATFNRTIKENSDRMIDNIKQIDNLINSNKLNTEQQNDFTNSLKENILKMEEQKTHLDKNSEGYKGLQSAIDFAKGTLEKYDKELNLAQDTIQRQIEKLEKENSTLEINSEKYKENQGKIDELRIKAEQLAKGDYSTAIEINADTTEVDNAKSIIGGFVLGNYVAKLKVESDTTGAKKGLTNFFKGMGSLGTGALSVLGMSGASIGSVISKINSFDVGTNYVPNDQLAMVHKGEMIVPAKYNPMTSNISGGHDEEIIEAIYELKETLENKEMNAYISEDDIGRASSNYRNRKSRQLGRDIG